VTRVRPVERDDLPRVAALFEAVMRSGGRTPPPGLAAYFERTWLDHPWADPELPSLVCEAHDGRILGFIGSHVRRLRFDGDPIRMVCPGQFVTDPEHRNPAAGAMLMRTLLSGHQDVTVAEGTLSVRRMIESFGGVVLQGPSVNWTRFFRPARALGDAMLARSRHPRWRSPARPVMAAVDAVAARTIPRLGTHPPAVRAEPLTPEALVEHMPTVLEKARIAPDYSAAFLGWLFAEMAAVRTRGALIRRLLRDDERVLGWYVAYAQPGGVGEVMQIAAGERNMPAVIDDLFHEARQSGTAALEGRLEPNLHEPLAGRGCLLRHGAWVVAQSNDSELVAQLAQGHSFITRMDGEWWMGHHREPFT
jgi:hypothetical protein